MRTALFSLALACVAAASASAGTVQVLVPIYRTPYPGAPPVATVQAAPLPTPASAGTWSITLADGDAVLLPLSVSSPTNGAWVGAAGTFDIPYFAVKSGRLTLAAPVVSDVANATSTAAFVRDASAMQALEDIFLLNARAHRIWDGRRATLRDVAMGQADAKVVFWLLQTEAVLIQQTHLRIDESVRAAATWMRTALQDPRQARLFAAGGVSAADAKVALAALAARETQLYSLVLNRLSRDVGSPDAAVAADACQRSKAMTAFYSDIRDRTAQAYAEWERHEVIATKNVALCATRTANAKLRRGEQLAGGEAQAASDVSARLRVLAEQLAKAQGSSAVVKEAVARAAELTAITSM